MGRKPAAISWEAASWMYSQKLSCKAVYSEALGSFENMPEGNVENGCQICLVWKPVRFSPRIKFYPLVRRLVILKIPHSDQDKLRGLCCHVYSTFKNRHISKYSEKQIYSKGVCLSVRMSAHPGLAKRKNSKKQGWPFWKTKTPCLWPLENCKK